MVRRNIKRGVVFGISAYIIWGFLPIYWKLLDDVRPDVVLAHRIIWSFVFMSVFIIVTSRGKLFIAACKELFNDKKKWIIITAASIVISLNWLIFIWAVQSNLVIQASLGYYINPLVSIVLGVLILKERLSKAQIVSVILACIGVIYLTISYGVFPWISLVLATSFALYGLLKKIVNIESIYSLAIETLMITPIALIYLLSSFGLQLGFSTVSMESNTLLIAAGVVTAVPLLLFGVAVINIPLSMTGILQYIAPTIMLFIGIFLYDEVFTRAHLFTFILIWTSLILYMASSLRQNKMNREAKQKSA